MKRLYDSRLLENCCRLFFHRCWIWNKQLSYWILFSMWQFFFNRIQYLEEISDVWLLYKHVCPEMVAEKMRDFGLNVSVCVCVYACVSRGQLWQPCWVCLCAPIPRRWQRVRGRKTRANLTALFIYILRFFPSALQPLSASDTENSHIAVSKEASLSLSLSLLFVLDSHAFCSHSVF